MQYCVQIVTSEQKRLTLSQRRGNYVEYHRSESDGSQRAATFPSRTAAFQFMEEWIDRYPSMAQDPFLIVALKEETCSECGGSGKQTVLP